MTNRAMQRDVFDVTRDVARRQRRAGLDSDCAALTICAAGVEDSNALCDDGLDNDGDGFFDCNDFGCSRSPNVTVCGVVAIEDSVLECSDNLDNDGDGFIDCVDFDCQASLEVTACDATSERNARTCFDSLDNDGDGFFDCDDTDCTRSCN